MVPSREDRISTRRGPNGVVAVGLAASADERRGSNPVAESRAARFGRDPLAQRDRRADRYGAA